MIKLKNYQQSSLNILRDFFESLRFENINDAYGKIQAKYYGDQRLKPYQPLKNLEHVPAVCLRLPTGGGKTLLSAHTISLVTEAYTDKEYPITLWLVPTNTIKSQTLETLTDPDHSNYQVLEKAFNGKFRIFDISDFRQIRPQDISNSACIVISTFASLRVDRTEGRKAYDHDENLESHFSSIPNSINGMERNEDGKIKFSFANLLHWHRPLVIVDEAHNANTDLSTEVLYRINASCIIEYTATPTKISNVIASVSASELKAEDMIKLPIILSEHVSWDQAVTASIQTRCKLEEIAIKDKDYIRPIVLFQAESKDREITVEILEKHLIENEGIERCQIAIVTGDQKELDTIDLFNPNCQIRYVITVQALKEGWDCSFAYVLCSVANTKSATSIEQLLGRVLRMPYAKARSAFELNRAYAHVSTENWPHAVTGLSSHLVNMGFEPKEVESQIYVQPSFFQEDAQSLDFTFTSKIEPDLSGLTLFEHSLLKVNKVFDQIYVSKVTENFDRVFADKIIASVKDPNDKKEVAKKVELYLNARSKNLSPAGRGEKLVVPQLCLNIGGSIRLAEVETCFEERGWSLLDYLPVLTRDEFRIDEQAKQYIVDLEGKTIKTRFLQKVDQLSFEGIVSEFTQMDLCVWLNRKLRSNDVSYEILSEFLKLVINNLLARDDLDILKLNRSKNILAIALKNKINDYKNQAYKKEYQSSFFGLESIVTVSPENYSFTFDIQNYPVNLFYKGNYKFNKHYYTTIAHMNGEEEECAIIIDQHPKVKYWIRNLDSNPQYAFSLPTYKGKFYPDFVVLLDDGKILIVEYKGEHLANEDTKTKELIGRIWAERSGNLFLMAWKKSEKGKNLRAQIEDIVTL